MKKNYIIIITLVLICAGALVPNIVRAVDSNGYATESDFIGNYTCGNTNFCFHKSLPNFTSTLYDVLKIATPIIIIVMGMLDMFKAASAQKEEDMKKAQQKFIKRLIAGAIVFLIFLVVEFVVNAISVSSNDANEAMSCVNCFLNGSKNCKTSTKCDK